MIPSPTGRWRRAARAAVLLLAGALASGCKQHDRPATLAPAHAVAPPPELAAYASVRGAGHFFGKALRWLRPVLPLPFETERAFDLLLARVGLPSSTWPEVARHRTFWLLAMTQPGLHDATLALIAVPIQQRERFVAALGHDMKPNGPRAPLQLYEPRGAAAAGKLLLWIGKTHAVIATSRRDFERGAPFLRGNLLPVEPEHQLGVHLRNVQRRQQDIEHRIDKVIAALRERARRRGASARASAATEATVRRWASLLAGTRELRLDADLEQDGLVLSLVGVGGARGKFKSLIAHQRPAEPVGQRLLPPSAWMVLADHASADAAAGPGPSAWIGALAPEATDHATIDATTRALAAALSGDLTVALHPPATGGGITLSAVLGVRDATKARAVVSTLAGWIGASAAETLAQRHPAAPAGRAKRRRPGGAGQVLRLPLGQAPGEAGALLRQLLGPELVVAWAVDEDHLLLTAGRDAAAQLQAMRTRLAHASRPAPAEPLPSLADNPAIARALAVPGRVGMIYLSPVDLLRGLQAAKVGSLASTLGDLGTAPVTAAPTVSWGVDAKRSAFDVTLRLPLKQLAPVWPLLEPLFDGHSR